MPVTGSIRTTRHHRCDEAFIALLEDDFGIPLYALNISFMGVPREPKKSAIALCAWASKAEDPGRALLAWARKNRRGTFRLDPEDVPDDQDEHGCYEGVVYLGQLVIGDDGEEVEVLEAVPCRRCHLLAGEEVKA